MSGSGNAQMSTPLKSGRLAKRPRRESVSDTRDELDSEVQVKRQRRGAISATRDGFGTEAQRRSEVMSQIRSFRTSKQSLSTSRPKNSARRGTGQRSIAPTSSSQELSIYPSRCKLTTREKLDLNGVEFVRWDETDWEFKRDVMAILNDRAPVASQSSDAMQIRARKIALKVGSNMSEADVVSTIGSVAFPAPDKEDVPKHIWRVQNETFTCDTVPNRRPEDVAPNCWYPIPKPRADLVIGYRWTSTLLKKMLQTDRIFPGKALQTTNGIFCGQFAVEFKSSFKGGTIADALDQVAGATATMSNALGLLVDASTHLKAPTRSATGPQTQPQTETQANLGLAADGGLRDCLVFGVALDEYVAYITAVWRSGPGQFRFAVISVHPLSFEADVLIFLRRVEAIKRWMGNRRKLIIKALEVLRNAARIGRDELTGGKARSRRASA